MTAPDVVIFVRHSAGCKYADDELFRRCNCRKHLRWTLKGIQHRKSAKSRAWSAAEEAKRRLVDQLSGKQPEPDAAENVQTIRTAVAAFVKDKEVGDLAAETVNTHKRELDRFAVFCENAGVYVLSGVNLPLLTDYKATWPAVYPSSSTRFLVQKRLGQFFRYCYHAGWITRRPKMSPVKVDEPRTLPLTEDEYTRLLSVITPENFQLGSDKRIRALVQLMRWSGLAIRDASGLKRSELVINEATGYAAVTTKRQKVKARVGEAKAPEVYIPMPIAIAKEVQAAANGDPEYIFWSPSKDAKGNRASSHYCGVQISRAYNLAGIKSQGHMVSHRLRDTFACDLLSKGVALEDVSKLLGHESIVTTEKHYASWVKGRQDRLDQVVSGTWKS